MIRSQLVIYNSCSNSSPLAFPVEVDHGYDDGLCWMGVVGRGRQQEEEWMIVCLAT